jgi:hypothetical protein
MELMEKIKSTQRISLMSCLGGEYHHRKELNILIGYITRS